MSWNGRIEVVPLLESRPLRVYCRIVVNAEVSRASAVELSHATSCTDMTRVLMRLAMRGVVLYAALLVAPGFAKSEPPEALVVRAYVSTAGPYGESWELNLKADGKVSLEILYMLNPMGRMSGEFISSPERLEALRQVISAERFAELPHEIRPARALLHQPDLRLTITTGERRHEVAVYDPDELEDDARVRRFLAVWKQVFTLVPLSPEW